MSQSQEEPLTCPFCGGDDVSVTDATRILGVWRLIHRCKVVGPISLEDGRRERVIKTWNTRALLRHAEGATITQSQEELREQVARVIDLEACVSLKGDERSSRLLYPKRRQAALTKADTIISLLRHAEGVGWRPIETAPRNGSRLFVWTPKGPVIARWVAGEPVETAQVNKSRRNLFRRHGGYWSAHFAGAQPIKGLPTHWMPLPTPPQEGGGGEDLSARDHASGDAQERCPSAQNSAGMADVLAVCAQQFRAYERSHRQKKTNEADIKADTNAHMARLCEEALSKADRPSPQSPAGGEG